MHEAFAYLETHHGRIEEELAQLLAIPSVSTQPEHAGDVDRCARTVASSLERLGLDVAITPTERHPIVFARWDRAPSKPAVLVYGHYDVQPPEPLEEWTSPPFAPTRRNGNLYARGASDDKGQIFAHIKGIEAWLRTAGTLPVNVKLLIEGEEEIGSPHLAPYIEANRDLLACDHVVISDTAQFAPGVPSIVYGLKGLIYFEITVRGPSRDLHSGACGGTVQNPANALCAIVAGLHDKKRRVTIPGFYDDVREPSAEERRAWKALGFDEATYRDHETGAPELQGEKGYSTLERKWARPTCDVNGIWGGYTQPGAKTIIPARASAKVSCRLVPDQDPSRVSKAFESWVQKICPPGVTVTVTGGQHGAPPVLVPLGSPALAAAERAIERGFGRKPVYTREGGTIPVVATFQELLGRSALLVGFGRPDDNIHAPNEKIDLADFHKGCRTAAALLEELGLAPPDRS